MGTGRATFNAITKYIQVKLNWSDDNGNAAGNRPDPQYFQPQLYATANVSAIPSDSLPVGSDWEITDNGDDTWILTLKDADADVVRGTYPYLWLTWTDVSIQDGPQQYFNDVRNRSDYGVMRASYSVGSTPIYYPYTKAFRIRLYWDDSANAAGLRPDPGKSRTTATTPGTSISWIPICTTSWAATAIIPGSPLPATEPNIISAT